jgi:hypothetical protein
MALSVAQKAAIKAYKAQKADRARSARATKAAITGPREDEWTGHDKPREQRSGSANPQATGPSVSWADPQRGKWIEGPDKAQHFVPDESWQPPVTHTAEPEPSVPQVEIVSIPNTGSHVGMRNGRMFDRQATAPLPQVRRPN